MTNDYIDNIPRNKEIVLTIIKIIEKTLNFRAYVWRRGTRIS